MDRLPREISRLEAPGTTPPENPAHPFWMIDISPIGEKHHGPEHRNPLTAGDISQEKTTSITSTEIPSGTRVEIQSDGQQTLVYGDSRRASEFNHVPGMNDVGYKNTEGIVECEIALRLAGISFPERDLVNLAIRHRLCESYVRSTDSGNVTYPIISGGTTLKQRAELIQQAGIPTELKSNVTIEDLAAWVKAEKAAIIPSSRWQEQDGGWVKTNESYVVVGAALDAQNPRHIVEFSALKAGEKGIQRLSPELLQSIWQEEKQGVALLVDTLKKQEAERPSFIGDTTQHAASTTLVETIHDIYNLEPLDPAAFKPSYLDFAPLLRERGLLSEQDIPWRRSFAATPEQREVYDRLAEGKISCFRGTLSDGREVLIAGDVQAAAVGHHEQGQNDLGYENTCSFVGMEGLLRQAGIDTSENELVYYAADHGLCTTDRPETWQNGATSVKDRQQLLADKGAQDVDYMFIHNDVGDVQEKLARIVEGGNGACIGVNAGLLYDRPDFYNGGYTNHALHVTGIMRDFHAVEEVLGVFVNDGNHVLGGTLLSRERMTLAFEEAYRATIETVRMRGSESPAS